MKFIAHYMNTHGHLYIFAVQTYSKLRTKRKGVRETISSMTPVVRSKHVIEGASSLGLDQDHLDSVSQILSSTKTVACTCDYSFSSSQCRFLCCVF